MAGSSHVAGDATRQYCDRVHGENFRILLAELSRLGSQVNLGTITLWILVVETVKGTLADRARPFLVFKAHGSLAGENAGGPLSVVTPLRHFPGDAFYIKNMFSRVFSELSLSTGRRAGWFTRCPLALTIHAMS